MKIEISKKSNAILKQNAKDKGISKEKYLKNLIKINENGIPFDVDKYSIEDTILVLNDILIHIRRLAYGLQIRPIQIAEIYIKNLHYIFALAEGLNGLDLEEIDMLDWEDLEELVGLR